MRVWLTVRNDAMDSWDPASLGGRLSARRSRAGFGVAPILYMLGLMGVGAGLLFSSYSQSIKNNVSMANSFTVKSDLDAAATTMAATSVLSSDGISLCPPQGGEATANCSAPALPVPPATKMYNFYPTANPVLSGDVHLPSGYATATTAGSPVETGVFMPGAGVKQFDPWGHYYVVCRWESATSSTDPAFVLLSAGPNGALETTCGSTKAAGDDQMLAMDASNAMNRSAIWQQGTLSTGSTGVYYGTVGSQLGVDQSGNLIVPGTITAGGSYSSINGGISLTNGDIVLTSGDISAVIGAFSGALSAASATITGNLSASGGAFLVGAGGDVTSTGNGSFTGSLAAGNGNVVISSSGTLTVGPGASPVMVVPAGAGSPVEINNELSLGSSTTTVGAVNIATTTPSTGVSVPLLSVGTPTGMPASPYLFYVDQAGNVAAATVTATSVSAGSVTASSVSGGAITATSITNSGTLSAGDTTLTDTTVNGNLTVSGSIIGNMNIGSGGVSFTGVMPIANGGTGANNITDALYNLGVTSTAAGIGHLNLNLLQNNYIPGAYLVSGSVTSTQLDNVLGVAPGTYNSVTVGADGRVTSGTFTATDVGSITDNVGETVTAGTTGITFTVGSTQQGIWTTVGLGIGTTIPGAPLDVNGNVRIQNAAGTVVPLNQLQLMNGATSQRWAVTTDGAVESGGSVGSNLVMQGYDNTGAIIATPAMSLTRTGNATFAGSVTAASFVGDGSGLTGIGTAAFTGVLGTDHGGTGTSTTFTPGSVVFAGASGVYDQNNANFFWDNTNARLGIGTTVPASSLQVANGGLLSVTGAFGSGATLPAGLTGVGTRMFYYPRKAAFRAGHVSGTQWDDANIGDASVAFGDTSTASGFASVAFGYYSSATGSMSFAAGMSNASGDSSTALSGGTASGMSSFAVGYSTASANYGASFGLGTVSASYADFVIGQYNVGGGTANSWVSTDPIFEIGIGTAAAYRANALTVLKNSRVGIGTASPASKLHVYGGEVQVGSSGVACTAANGGAVRYDSGTVYYCDGTSAWKSLLTAGAGIGSGIYLGTSSTVTNPSREGEAGTGLYTAGAGLVDVAASGVQIAEFGSTGINIATGSLRLAGVNGISFPADYTTNASIAIGSGALAYQTASATATQGNIAMGYQALGSSALTTSAVRNAAIGYQALMANTSGLDNTAVGYRALTFNTTGTYNIAVGGASLMRNTTGTSNVALGWSALYQNTTGASNTALGHAAAYDVTTAQEVTAVGRSSLENNTGSGNTALGSFSLYGVNGSSTGGYNTALGYQAGYDVTTGTNNIFLGRFSTTGVGVTTGNNNIMIGYDVRPPSQTADNQLNIGNLIYATSLASGATASTGYVGVGTPAPVSSLHVASGGLFAVTGTYGSGDALPAGLAGAGTRMFFYPRKAAFRAGRATGTQWDDANIGNYSTAFGYGSTASGGHSTAFGDATATGYGSVALGFGEASGFGSTALSGIASGIMSTSMGGGVASGYASVAMGEGVSSGDYSVSLGYGSVSAAYGNVAIGQYNVGGGTAGSWVATDPLFEIGIGTADTARVNALTVLKNGRVGIGTANPIYKTDVSGSMFVCRNIGGINVCPDGHVYMAAEHSNGEAYSGVINAIGQGGDTVGVLHLGLAGNQGTASHQYGIIMERRTNSLWYSSLVNPVANGTYLPGLAFAGQTNTTSGGGMVIGASINGVVNGTVSSGVLPTDITFRTSLTNAAGLSEKMRIMSSGQVGVGTAAPASLLHVYGGEVQIGSSGAACTAANGGAIRYDAGYVYYCDGSSAWQAISVAGAAVSAYLGTSVTTTNPSINGDATTGLYTAGAGLVDVAAAGVQIAEFGATGINIATGSLRLAGVNGLSFPPDYTLNGSIAIGSGALAYQTASATTGQVNVAVGYQSMGASGLLSTANQNTAVGYKSLQSLTSGTANTAIGYYAMQATTSASGNTAIGVSALDSNTTGFSNVAVGVGALTASVTGAGQVAIGYSAAQAATAASGITAVGSSSAYYNTGSYNVALGPSALFGVSGSSTGGYNTAVGYQAGYDVTTGASNIFLGRFSTTGVGVTTGNNNIMIGYDVRPPSQTADNQLNIGNLIYATSLASGATVSTGYVGIGTAAPAYPLDVESSASTATIYANNTATSGTSYGVYGSSANSTGYGVYGRNTAASGNAYGVYGISTTSGGGTGVYGSGGNNGVYGVSGGNTGVYGQGLTYGVQGQAAATGVFGRATASTGRGVYGRNTNTSGVGYGVHGSSSSSEGYGVYGDNLSSGIGGYFTSASGYALITGTGNVGIGTDAPASTLAVNGSVGMMFGSDLTTTGSQNDVAIGTTSALRYNGTADATFTGIVAGANGQVLYIHNPSSYTLTLSNQSASSAAANRIVTGTGADLPLPAGTSVALQYDSTAALWRVTGSSNASTSTPAGATTQVQYNDNGAFGANEYMTWDNTNKLLAVGTTAAIPVAATGTVAGATVNVIPKTEAFGSLNGTSNMISGTAGTVGQMAYYSNANEISSTANLYVSAGNIGIATDAPSYTLTVNGNAWVTGGAWSGSDRRWKKDIVPLHNALDTISKLQGVSYNWRVDEFPSKRFTADKQLGLIAQDVEKVVPEAVTTDKEGYKGIDYQKLTPLLIEAVKQLKADNDNLRAEIEALKAQRR